MLGVSYPKGCSEVSQASIAQRLTMPPLVVALAGFRLTFACCGVVPRELSDARGLVPAESVEHFLWEEFGIQSAHIVRCCPA